VEIAFRSAIRFPTFVSGKSLIDELNDRAEFRGVTGVTCVTSVG
jgi:hypothetical protein